MSKERYVKSIKAALEIEQLDIEYNRRRKELKKNIQDNLTVYELLNPHRIGEDLTLEDLNMDIKFVKKEGGNHSEYYDVAYKDVCIVINEFCIERAIPQLTKQLFKNKGLEND